MTSTRKGVTVTRVVERTFQALTLASGWAASCLPFLESLGPLEPGMTSIFPADPADPPHLGLDSKQASCPQGPRMLPRLGSQCTCAGPQTSWKPAATLPNPLGWLVRWPAVPATPHLCPSSPRCRCWG